MTHLLVRLAADEGPRYTYDTLKPGPWALVVTALLAVALVILVRSMRNQLRKVRFDPDATTDAERARSREDPRDRQD